MASEPNHAFPR